MQFKNILIDQAISLDKLKEIVSIGYGNMVKAVADMDKGLLVIGHEMHFEGEEYLLDQGSEQKNLWGFNIYPDSAKQDWFEFNSMINIRPNDGNKSHGVESEMVQAKIKEIVYKLIQE